jgi:hypothetical protein
VAGSVGALFFTGKVNPRVRGGPVSPARIAVLALPYLLRTGFPMLKVARKMVNAPSNVIALPMTGMVDIDATITYMYGLASFQSF